MWHIISPMEGVQGEGLGVGRGGVGELSEGGQGRVGRGREGLGEGGKVRVVRGREGKGRQREGREELPERGGRGGEGEGVVLNNEKCCASFHLSYYFFLLVQIRALFYEMGMWHNM